MQTDLKSTFELLKYVFRGFPRPLLDSMTQQTHRLRKADILTATTFVVSRNQLKATKGKRA